VEAAADGAPPTTQGLARRATGNVRQPPMYSGPTPGRTTNGRLRRRLPFNRQTRPAAASLKQWFGSAGRTLAHGLERRRRTAANQHHQFGRLVPVGEIGGSAVSPCGTRGSRNHGCILPTDWPPLCLHPRTAHAGSTEPSQHALRGRRGSCHRDAGRRSESRCSRLPAGARTIARLRHREAHHLKVVCA